MLTAAAIIKAVVQLFTPVLLVRVLDQTEFGQFRLFWLIANTAMLLLTLGMGRSLLYFLPKSSAEERGRYLSQTAVYFLGVAILAALFIVLGERWLSDSVTGLTQPDWVLAAFLLLWVAAAPVRYVANADQNVAWQAKAIIVIALLRTITVLATAAIFRDIQAVFYGLLVWAGMQFLILAYYTGSRHGRHLRVPSFSGIRDQFFFAAPFGLSQTLSGARRTVAEWIVVFLFNPQLLAVFSIGTSFNAVLRFVRGSLGNVLLPKISKSHAAGDTERAVRLNNRGNVAVCALVTPMICWLWAFAEPVITLMYTAEYLGAVPVLRVYLLMLLAMTVELGSVLMVLKQGRFVLTVSSGILLGSALLSYVGGLQLGLWGVALGGLFGELIGRLLNFMRASRQLGLPLSALQDWSTLARILLAGALSVVSSSLATSWLAVANPFALVAVGSVVFAASYVAFAAMLGLSWLVPILLGRARWR